MKKINRRKPAFSRRLGDVRVSIQEIARPSYSFVVSMHKDGKRGRQRYTKTIGEAKTIAEQWIIESGNIGAQAAASLSDSDKRAVAEFHARVKEWANPPSLREAIAFFLERREKMAGKLTVAQMITTRIDDATAAKLSSRHLSDLRSRLDRFAVNFGDVDIRTIESGQIRDWLGALRVGPQTKVNYLRVISSVFEIAIRNGKLERNPCNGVTTPKVTRDIPAILSPTQLNALLKASSVELRPLLVLQCFCGLRRAEALRMDWGKLDFEDGNVDVGAGIAKAASRRLAPLTDAAIAWLRPIAKVSGPLALGENAYRRELNRAREAAGIDVWEGNELRHSFGSYRLALVNNDAQVALEMGNSPNMVHAHYKSVVKPKAAAAYFGVKPI